MWPNFLSSVNIPYVIRTKDTVVLLEKVVSKVYNYEHSSIDVVLEKRKLVSYAERCCVFLHGLLMTSLKFAILSLKHA